MMLASMKKIHYAFILLLIIFSSLIIYNTDEVRSVLSQYTKIDKIGHFIGFFFLTWLLSHTLKLPLVNLSLTLILYSALTEIGQHYLGFRNGELKDFVADVFGILTFMFIKWCSVIYSKKQVA